MKRLSQFYDSGNIRFYMVFDDNKELIQNTVFRDDGSIQWDARRESYDLEGFVKMFECNAKP